MQKRKEDYMASYDLVIVGGGPGGSAAAIEAAAEVIDSFGSWLHRTGSNCTIQRTTSGRNTS